MNDKETKIGRLLGSKKFLQEILPAGDAVKLTAEEHASLHTLICSLSDEAIRRMFLTDTPDSNLANDSLFEHAITCPECNSKLERLLNAELTQAEIDEMSV